MVINPQKYKEPLVRVTFAVVSGNGYGYLLRQAIAWLGAFCMLKSDITKPQNMIDINEIQEKKPFLWKDWLANLLIANVPASFLIVMLKELGVTGVLPTIIILFGGMLIVSKVRKSKATRKTIFYALLANFVAFFIVPIIMLELS